MPEIKLQTTIQAPIEEVFDLARNIDLHIISTEKTREKVIEGKDSGFLELNDTVTWKARHLGVWQALTSKMIEYERPYFFADKMLNGAFKSMKHEHHFVEFEQGTLMVDMLFFESPLGILGKIADQIFLTKYMTDFIKERNAVLKRAAESGEWKKILN